MDSHQSAPEAWDYSRVIPAHQCQLDDEVVRCFEREDDLKGRCAIAASVPGAGGTILAQAVTADPKERKAAAESCRKWILEDILAANPKIRAAMNILPADYVDEVMSGKIAISDVDKEIRSARDAKEREAVAYRRAAKREVRAKMYELVPDVKQPAEGSDPAGVPNFNALVITADGIKLFRQAPAARRYLGDTPKGGFLFNVSGGSWVHGKTTVPSQD